MRHRVPAARKRLQEEGPEGEFRDMLLVFLVRHVLCRRQRIPGVPGVRRFRNRFAPDLGKRVLQGRDIQQQ
jgi:hypothetical protein